MTQRRGQYAELLAPYACKPNESRGRLFEEEEAIGRSPYQRDRDRIVHCSAFRRLKHKTQVFVYHEGDYYRTRLTHSIEVAQIARAISRALGLNEDLAEALALVHDFGHTPFGHAGEDALAACMEPYGGFDHNAQSLRIVTRLEERYADFDGLNLTWETLEGLAKHNGPLIGGEKTKYGHKDNLPFAFMDYLKDHDLEIDTFASAEAQVAALADDIAYNNHDIDDALRAGLITETDLMELPLVGVVVHGVRANYPDISRSRMKHEVIRRLINVMVTDVIKVSKARLNKLNPKSVEDIRKHSQQVISFSGTMKEQDRVVKDFLWNNMYRHYKVNRMTTKAKRVVTELFDLFMDAPECLPSEWHSNVDGENENTRARFVCDYIAGMTDKYALELHKKLYDVSTLQL